MLKFSAWLIEFFNWLAIFAAPLTAGVGVGFMIYVNNERLWWLSILFASAGAIVGVIIAEYIRKKYGCSRYLGKIRATPDMWPDESSEEAKAKKKDRDLEAAKRKIK